MNDAKDKKIYIVVSHCNTIIGKAIRAWIILNFWNRSDGDKYPHSSLSLDDNLDNMMSFGRRFLYMPLIGGIVKEDIRKGLYTRASKKGKIAVIALPVTEEQYKSIQGQMDEDWYRRKVLKYNIIAFLSMCFTGKGVKRRNRYICSHWVAEKLEQSDVYKFEKKIWNIRPSYLYDVFKEYVIFEGYIQDYVKKVDTYSA